MHVSSFFSELEALEQKGIDAHERLFVSDRCHITSDLHKLLDGLEEEELGQNAVGTVS